MAMYPRSFGVFFEIACSIVAAAWPMPPADPSWVSSAAGPFDDFLPHGKPFHSQRFFAAVGAWARSTGPTRRDVHGRSAMAEDGTDGAADRRADCRFEVVAREPAESADKRAARVS